MLSNYISLNGNVNTNLLPWNLNDPQPGNPNTLGIILAFNPARLAVLNAIIILSKRFRLVYASQARIAKMAKVHLKTAQKEIQALTQLGLIAKKYNGANKTCWYKSSTYFNDLGVMESLSKKISLFYFTLRMLISSPSEDTTRSIIDLRSKETKKYKKASYELKKEEKVMEKPKTGISTKGDYNVSKQGGETKHAKPWLPSSIIPFSSKCFEDNINRWNKYEDSYDVRSYVSYFGDKAIVKQRNEFMEKLYKQHKGAITVDAITPEIKRQSIETQVVMQEQPKCQETKKDSTVTNVVNIIKKESGLIVDEGERYTLIPKDHKDYKKFSDPSYNPFEEDLDW
jgi:hypothetical protein